MLQQQNRRLFTLFRSLTIQLSQQKKKEIEVEKDRRPWIRQLIEKVPHLDGKFIVTSLRNKS